MLDAAVAQTIVNRTMSVLHVNVNIMDVNGLVIAAGHRERIGTFHSAAAEVIATGRKKTVSAAEAARMDGVMPGITLPIIYKGAIQGALGMTGEPAQVEKYGELVVLTALLIIEQEEMKEQVYQERQARESVLIDLFTGRCLEDESLFRRRSTLLEGKLDQPHLVMAAHLTALEEGHDPLQLQRRRTVLSDRLAALRIRGRPVATCFLEGRLAILSPIPRDALRSRQQEDAQQLYTFLREETGSGLLLSVGGLCPDWRGIPHAFARAEGALDIARTCGTPEGTFFFEDYLTEYALLRLPLETRREFCTCVLGSLSTCRDDQRELWLNTLRHYYRNDMNAQKTADELFLHRNTLNMRLNKIRDLTGYSPQRFQDAFVLRMALVLSGMDESRQQETETRQT